MATAAANLPDAPAAATGAAALVPKPGPELVSTPPRRPAKGRLSRAANTILPIRRVAYLKWKHFLVHMMREGASESTFENISRFLWKDYYIAPDPLAVLILTPRLDHYALNPRMQMYLYLALKEGYVDVPSILAALLRFTTLSEIGQSPDTDIGSCWKSSYATDEAIFWQLAKCMSQPLDSPTGPTRRPEFAIDTLLHIVKRLAAWANLFIRVYGVLTNDVLGQVVDVNTRMEIDATHNAFVTLLLRTCEHPGIVRALAKPYAIKCRKIITHSLQLFISSCVQNPHITDRLNNFRLKISELDPCGAITEAEAEQEDSAASDLALEAVASKHIPLTNSRAALYIYLNACLVGRPVIDDAILCNLIRNRYQHDIQNGVVDLILASFDVLANAAFQNEHKSTAQLLRSYLTNKLPLLIVTLSPGLYPTTTPEFVIQMALNQVDPNTFPTLAAMFDDTRNNNNDFTENMRDEFCFACCLHGLIAESSIPALLGETYSTLPPGGKYSKAMLVQEAINDPERAIRLLDELDKTNGNVGAVCQALVEVFGQLCANRDTSLLKTLCSQLARQPRALDVIQLFEKPVTLLQPLCNLLDGWKYDEDQGEYQPVYEEFGSILLLVMAFAYRYNLSPPDMGIRSPDSFVAKLIREGHLSKTLAELTPTEESRLSVWTHSLFGGDTGGLTDELMASCPPQDFYLLVATLFKNMVVANSEGTLSDEALKGGIEYLVDTFLMPSLVPAVLFLADQLSVDLEQEQLAMVKILHLILQPKAIHNDTAPMLVAVMNLTAKPLERALRRYQRRYPTSQAVEPLLAAIKDCIPLSRRTGGADHNELEAWCATPSGGLAIAVRSTIHGFVQWSLNPMIGVSPTLYTHRQILAAIRRMTAQHVIRLIIDEIKAFTAHGSPAQNIAYDVALALIVSPEVTNYPEPVPHLVDDLGNIPIPTQRRLTLREVLGMKATNFREIHRIDPEKAEIVIRLHRHVEEQMAPAPAPPIIDVDIALPLAANAEVDATAQAAAAAGADGTVQQGSADGTASATSAQPTAGDALSDGMDLGMDMGMGDMSVIGSAGGAMDLNGDGDLFGGLGGADDFTWDSIDVIGL
ncbi:Mediator of RNA polymerase II transcription subunit 5 [Ceratocystis fimbriata CBS 114723]|uniref:Mediator of RNA polymerase II transcription subunit 5 n=1 Tax=Ceratocystis fimbriata CBS 114723 TaxID=1035309 RepID=A0A2C5X4I0_9PEZI|nr:Mediator of RNA polymerase II transcription subunit 5 [Ceratocystis fimbriata CBS 114723]